MASAASSATLLIDSDVLIWYARGNANALKVVNNTPLWAISAVTYMELVQGCRNKAELKAMQVAFKSHDSDILPITEAVSDAACALVEKHALSHRLYLADALIAATAMAHDFALMTVNGKHFSAISGLKIKLFKP